MPTSAAAIDRTTADEARIELESHNQGLIATSQAESSPSFLHLNTSEALTKVSKACEAFGKAYAKADPTARIKWSQQPVLCIRQPRSDPIVMEEAYGCLALGKVGGGEAAELGTGNAYVWRPGEKHEFGDVGAIYIGFKVE